MRRVLALIFLTLSITGFGGAAMAIEQPKYSVQLTDGDFELRRYAPYLVAQVVVEGDQGQSVQKGFRKLAGYIFGANKANSKIAMTAPVAQQPVSEKIAMTSPVSQTPLGASRWKVQFMMPPKYALDSLPVPNDPDIAFHSEPAREMAVLRFSGVAREKDYREKVQALRHWATARKLAVRGDATLAQYDPPWTLWFLRRNEVMLEITP